MLETSLRNLRLPHSVHWFWSNHCHHSATCQSQVFFGAKLHRIHRNLFHPSSCSPSVCSRFSNFHFLLHPSVSLLPPPPTTPSPPHFSIKANTFRIKVLYSRSWALNFLYDFRWFIAICRSKILKEVAGFIFPQPIRILLFAALILIRFWNSSAVKQSELLLIGSQNKNY